METILETLPNVGDTVSFVAMGWLLSNNYTDVVRFVMAYTVQSKLIVTHPHFQIVL